MVFNKLFGKKKQNEFNLSVLETDVLLNQVANGKDEVFAIISDLMVKNNYVSSSYKDALKGREEQSSTYLMNGIAIPHGRREDKKLVNKTGVVIAQFKNGVDWNEEDKVFLAVGIAAKSDEHLQILAKLTQIVINKDLALNLGTKADLQTILNTFNTKDLASLKTIVKEESEDTNQDENSLTLQVKVVDKLGFHARPATKISTFAKSFKDAELEMTNKNNKTVKASSTVGILSLAVRFGETVTLKASGKDAEKALNALKDAIEKGFDD